MGYYVSMIVCVTIPKEHNEDVKRCLHRLIVEDDISWADHITAEDTIEELFNAIRYEGFVNDAGDFELSEFTGGKLGDDGDIWAALAPFVAEDSVIYCSGEDDYYWRWTFKNGLITETLGEVIYESDLIDEIDVLRARVAELEAQILTEHEMHDRLRSRRNAFRDERDRLREALQLIVDVDYRGYPSTEQGIARAALSK